MTESSSMDGLPGILGTLFGSLLGNVKEMKIKEIHLEKKCVKECPLTIDDDKKKVKADKSRRICLVEDEDSMLSFLGSHTQEDKKDVLS